MIFKTNGKPLIGEIRRHYECEHLYEFVLKKSNNPVDPSGLYWKMCRFLSYCFLKIVA